jgi:hypothetical protein
MFAAAFPIQETLFSILRLTSHSNLKDSQKTIALLYSVGALQVTFNVAEQKEVGRARSGEKGRCAVPASVFDSMNSLVRFHVCGPVVST